MNFSLNYQDGLVTSFLDKVGPPRPLQPGNGDTGAAFLTLSQLDEKYFFSLTVAQNGGDRATDPVFCTEILNSTQLDLLYQSQGESATESFEVEIVRLQLVRGCQSPKRPSAPLAAVPSAGCDLLGYAEEKLPKPPRSWSRGASQKRPVGGQTSCENVLKCRNKQTKNEDDIHNK